MRKASKTIGTAFGWFIQVIKIAINIKKTHSPVPRVCNSFVLLATFISTLYPHESQKKAFNYIGLGI